MGQVQCYDQLSNYSNLNRVNLTGDQYRRVSSVLLLLDVQL